MTAKRIFLKTGCCNKFHDCHNWTEMDKTRQDPRDGEKILLRGGRGIAIEIDLRSMSLLSSPDDWSQ